MKNNKDERERAFKGEVQDIIAISMCGLNQPLWETRQKVESKIEAMLEAARREERERIKDLLQRWHCAWNDGSLIANDSRMEKMFDDLAILSKVALDEEGL